MADTMAAPHLPLSFVGCLLIAILGCGNGVQDGDGKPAGSAGVGTGDIFVHARVGHTVIAEHTI